jgi:transcriptional regulator with XRE-family HTH domain
VIDASPFFKALGTRVRALRKQNGMTLDDVISYGFSARHWQQIEKGRKINVTTILRICALFQIPLAKLVCPLDFAVDLKDLRKQMREVAGRR